MPQGQSLLAALDHLDKAFKNFFAGRAKYPVFKKKYAGWQSFQCPQHVTVDFDSGKLNLPKLKSIKIQLHRPFAGIIKTVTIKRSPSGRYTASILVDDEQCNPIPAAIEATQTLGIDVGLTHFLIDSDGHKIDNPRHLKAALGRLAVEQKKLARSKTGSGRRAKQKHRVAILHETIAGRRRDFVHQETAKLAVKNHATSFVVEDLNIKGMIKNRKLARAIQDAGWGTFLSVLDYKCRWQGKNLIRIGRFEPSSKHCHACQHTVKHLPLSIRAWQCPQCGAEHDRDINAAKNIRTIGLADALGLSACVKSSPVTKPVSAGVAAKGVGLSTQHGSHEASARAAQAA